MFQNFFKNGWNVEASGGKAFLHQPSGMGFAPVVNAQFLSDNSPRREVWLPHDRAVTVKLDTGADVTCLHWHWMNRLGLRTDSRDVITVTCGAGQKVKAFSKFARIRISGFLEPFPIPILYSADFHDNLINFSMKGLVDHYGVVLTEERTILFPK